MDAPMTNAKLDLSAATKLVGQPIPPANNARFVAGNGFYTDDLTAHGALHMVLVRSPHASAYVRSVRTEVAASSPGVVAVLTGADVVHDGLGSLKSFIERKRPDGSRHFEPPFPLLATDIVNHVGFPVAIVLADSRANAETAAELVEVDYEPRASITKTSELLRPDAPKVWDSAADNICFVHTAGNEAAVDAAIAAAEHVVSVDVAMSRVSANPMEMRNAVAEYDRRTERYTLWTGSQIPHDLRAELLPVLKIGEQQLRIISPDIGGAFGLKLPAYAEQVLALWAARRTGRVVRWQATRNESFQSDYHSRDVSSHVTLGLDRDGRFVALKADCVANLGAYLHAFTLHPPVNNLGGIAGPYRTPHIFVRVTGAFSNSNSNGAYRGAGRPEATYLIERVIDAAARKLGLDRAEIRRRNLIPVSAMPHPTGFLFTYDSGEFERNLDTALSISSWADFEARRQEAAKRGRIRGIGLANAIEIAGGPQGAPTEEFIELRFDRAGGLSVLSGLHSHGHGLETVLPQLLHDELGVPLDKMRVTFGDTDIVYHGKGSGGSRSAAAASATATTAAKRIVDKGRTLAAHVFERPESDIEFANGAFSAVGSNHVLSLADMAKISFDRTRLPKGMDIGLSTSATVAASNATFPNGCHVCEVEIDPDTGVVQLIGYWAVEDVGRVLNPLVVEGQVHGGVTQGIGQALLEEIRYDSGSGQLLTASFMDYAMPRADDLPSFVTAFNEVLTKTNPHGAKGVGEAGTVAAIVTVMNAVNDALTRAGASEIEMPATPQRVWRALKAARVP
jgi:aerobic carbon-monoxide dehydrogenase large subunit